MGILKYEGGFQKGCGVKDGSSGELEIFACSTAGRFLPWTMCDPHRAEVAENEDGALMGCGDLSLGGPCWKGEIQVVDMG